MGKPREYFLLNMLHAYNSGRVLGFDNIEAAEKSVKAQPDAILGVIPVIEKSAADKLAKRIKSMIDEIEYFRKINPNVSPTPSTLFAEQDLKQYRGESDA